MMVYISAMDQARKSKFSSFVHLPSINKMFQYHFFEHGCYISALEHVRMLILSSYILLACINAIFNMVTIGQVSSFELKSSLCEA